MFDIEELETLVKLINKKVNVPFLGEKGEGFLIRSLIREMERIAKLKLDFNLKFVMQEIGEGVTSADLSILKEDLIIFINDNIDIPMFSEKKEAQVIKQVLDFLLDSLAVGKVF